jgi:hypothetical protein
MPMTLREAMEPETAGEQFGSQNKKKKIKKKKPQGRFSAVGV